MERLDFSDESGYNAIEASIHLNRYLTAKKFVEGKKVLDVACGQGYGSALLKRWGANQVIGVDVSEEALLIANQKFATNGVSFINHAAEKLPFEDEEFDVVVSYETIEHVDYPEKFLQEIKRVSKKNATIIVSCPNDPYYYKQENYHNPYHKCKYTWYDFAELSKKYLGNDVAWHFGFATNGFMTVAQSQCKFPEKDDLAKVGMSEMLNMKSRELGYSIEPDRYINHWNANYYLGIWGNGNRENIDTVITFPREFFIEPDDPIFADITAWNKKHKKEKRELEERLEEEADVNKRLLEKYNNLKEKVETFDEETRKIKQILEEEKKILELKFREEKNNLEVLLEKNKNELHEMTEKYVQIENELNKYKSDYIELKQRNIDLTEEKRVTDIQERRTSALLEVANTEKGYLWNRINDYERKIQELNQECERKEQNNKNIVSECESKITNLENHSTQLKVKADEYERYQRSISYKLMQPVRKVWDVLRFWKK